MSDTVDIGAARVRLIVDGDDFEQAVAAGKIAIRGFSSDAQAAYDRTEKATRRAADALLDYVHALGSADSTMTKLISRASNLGVEKTLIDAAVRSWQAHNDQVDAANAAQAGYNDLLKVAVTQEKAALAAANATAKARFENLQGARAAQSQQAINALVAPGLAVSTDTSAHRLAAEEVFAGVIAQENALLEAQVELVATAANDQAEHVKAVNAAYKELLQTQDAEEQRVRAITNAQAETRIQNIADARAAQSQQAINALVAPGLAINTQAQQQREDAEAAFAALVQEENKALEDQATLVDLIGQARQAANATNAQYDYNKLLGIPQEEEKLALIQRRKDAEAAYLPVLEEEIKLENENSQLVAKQQAFIQQLENTATTAGKTYYEMLQLRAAELGLGEAYQPLINKIKEQNQAMGAGTLSAKQYEFALRGLPAQFTDIVVSLQAGQRPFTVLLQQGGQIKDMFGGVDNAIKVVAKEVLGIVTNPLFVLAGVAALVGAAFAEASSRTADFAIAAAKGNLVAGNAKGLSTLAEQLSKLNNISIGHADEAVQSLAAAGKLTGENFALAAEASARWATVTGQSADTIIGKFNELANDPMQAVLDGTLKVTEAQYEQLQAFERTGQKAKEAQLAVKLYADQINNDSASVLENLSEAQKGWIDLKDAITGAWHAFTSFVADAAGTGFNHLKVPTIGDLGLAGTGGEGAVDLLNQSDQQATPLFGGSPQTTRSGFGGVGIDPATIAQGTKPTTDQVNANKELQKSIDDLGTKQQKFSAALVLENGLLSRSSDRFLKLNGIVKDTAGTFSGPGYDKLMNGLHLKFFGQNEGGDVTKPIKEWEKTTLDAIKNVSQAYTIEFEQQSIDATTYYDALNRLALRDEEVQLSAIDKQQAALKRQGNPNNTAQLAALEQQRQTVLQTFAHTRAANDDAELKAIQAKINGYHDYIQQLADANIALSRQGDQAARGVGLGSREAALANAQDNARQADALRQRQAQDAVNALGPGDHTQAQIEADQKKEASAAALSTQLDILKGNYDSLATAESSFLGGSVKAWQDWSANVSNYAQEAGKVFTDVTNDIVEDLDNAAIKGKLSFGNLLTTLEKDIIDFGTKQALKIALANILPTSAGGGANANVNVAGYLSSLLGIAGAVSGGASFGGAIAASNALDSLVDAPLPFAHGGAFGTGSGLASYRNSIVTRPTVFPFAKGGVPNVGVMGEKSGSPGEGIFPLTRTAGGDLAVKAVGDNGPSRVTNVNQTIVVPGATTRATQDQIGIKVFGSASRAIRRSK